MVPLLKGHLFENAKINVLLPYTQIIDTAVNDFMLEGEKISSKAPAAQKDEFVLTEKQFSKAIKDYRLGR